MSVNKRDARHETHETPIGKLLETRLLNLAHNLDEKHLILTAVRLEKELGVGDHPAIRRSLYRKLEALQREHGAAVWKVIWRALKRSRSAKLPGRYFCAVAIDELEQLGFLTRLH